MPLAQLVASSDLNPGLPLFSYNTSLLLLNQEVNSIPEPGVRSNDNDAAGGPTCCFF